MAGPLYANNITTTLAGGVGPSDGTITVVSSSGMPAPGAGEYFWVTLQSVDGTVIEIVKCTSRAGAVLTVTRAQDGTAAASFTAGAFVELRIPAQALRDLVTAAVVAATYLPTATAAATYLPSATAAATYLTIANASATYLPTATAAATYLTQLAAAATYLTIVNAAAAYLTTAAASATYLTQASAASTYLTQVNAAAAYLSIASASATYVPLTGGPVGPITINGGKLLSKITVSSSAPGSLADGELYLKY